MLSFFLLGMFFLSLAASLLEGGILVELAKKGVKTTIQGVVVGEPRGGTGLSFDLKAKEVKDGRSSLRTSEMTRVILQRSGGLIIRSGQQVEVEGVPVLPSNEGAFDYRRHLFRRGIATVFFSQPSDVKVIGETSSAWTGLRERIKAKVSSLLSPDQAGLLVGILLGDRSGIHPGIESDFKRAGVAHILAVSGLHVGMMASITFLFMRFLKARLSFQYLAAAGAVTLYVFLVGGRPSILRASIMISLGFLGWFLARGKGLLPAVSTAALALLLYNPFLVYNVAFQLSFAAVLSIILVFPFLSERESRPNSLYGWFSAIFFISLTAQLGVAPILVYHFNELSLVALVANPLVVPLIAPILALGILGSFLAFASSFLACPIFRLNGLLLSLVIKVAGFFSSLPGACVSFGSPSLPMVGCYYLVLASGLFFWKRRRVSPNFGSVLVVLLLLLVVPLWWQVARSTPPHDFTATFLNVGQGDAILIQAATGEVILVDGGESTTLLRQKLARRGIGKIDLLVLSHPHADHVGGLVWVVRNLTIGMVLDGGQAHTSDFYRQFLMTIDRRGIPYRLARRGEEFVVGDDFKVIVLHPTEDFIAGTKSDLNNNSVVLKVVYGKFSLLLPGDVEAEAETALLGREEDIDSTVLKVPHHGSASGGSAEFLRGVSPRVAVISVGEDNSFGHPASSTLSKLRSIGADVYRTDRHGDVTITTDGEGFTVEVEHRQELK